MASSGPRGKAYPVRCAPGFVEHAAKLIGSFRAWDEIQETFDQYLSRIPDYGHEVTGELRAISLLTDPLLTVYYTVIHDDHVLELLEVKLV
jgi:hypothetical protein